MVSRFGAATLESIVRQARGWTKEVIKNLTDGNSRQAIDHFAKRGLITLTKTEAEAKQSLIQEWMRSRESVRDRLILASSTSDAKEMNSLAQRARKSELGTTWVSVAGIRIYRGDRVSFGKSSKSRGIVSGDRGELVAINPLPRRRAATVKLDDGRKVTVDLARFPFLRLGYASTPEDAHGTSRRAVYILAKADQDRNAAYVAFSRGETNTRLFMTEADAGSELQTMVKGMNKKRERTIALTEIRRQRGISL